MEGRVPLPPTPTPFNLKNNLPAMLVDTYVNEELEHTGVKILHVKSSFHTYCLTWGSKKIIFQPGSGFPTWYRDFFRLLSAISIDHRVLGTLYSLN